MNSMPCVSHHTSVYAQDEFAGTAFAVACSTDNETAAPPISLDLLPRELRTLHDDIVEQAFDLDLHGRTDASDELNQVAQRLRDLLSRTLP